MSVTRFPHGIWATPNNGTPLLAAHGQGDHYYVCAATTVGFDTNAGTDPGQPWRSLSTSETKLTGNQNDILFLLPSSTNFDLATTALTWDLSNTHLIGVFGGSPWANNITVTHTSGSACNNMLTVSGSNNYIANLHLYAGVGSSTSNLYAVYNTGSGNHYENMWVEHPCNATLADENVVSVRVDGGGNYFRNMIIGSTSVTRTDGGHIGWTGSCYRSTWENVLTYGPIDATDAAEIICTTAYDISGPQFFRNCMFTAWWNNVADQGTFGIEVSGGSMRTGILLMDQNCGFYGYDDVCHGSCSQWVFMGNASATATTIGLATNPTVS